MRWLFKCSFTPSTILFLHSIKKAKLIPSDKALYHNLLRGVHVVSLRIACTPQTMSYTTYPHYMDNQLSETRENHGLQNCQLMLDLVLHKYEEEKGISSAQEMS